jgi:hypothetical protein
MSGNRIGFVVLTRVTESDGTPGAFVTYQEVTGPRAVAENERDRQRAHYEVDVRFGDDRPDRYAYEVAELVTCDPAEAC